MCTEHTPNDLVWCKQILFQILCIIQKPCTRGTYPTSVLRATSIAEHLNVSNVFPFTQLCHATIVYVLTCPSLRFHITSSQLRRAPYIFISHALNYSSLRSHIKRFRFGAHLMFHDTHLFFFNLRNPSAPMGAFIHV